VPPRGACRTTRPCAADRRACERQSVDQEVQARLAAFRQELDRLGWSKDRNLQIDIRFTKRADHFQAFAPELVSLKPDVLLAVTTPVAAALRRQTHVIPIVFINVSDPIGSDLIAGLARPGGNLTGLLLYEEGITGEWMALLKEIAPHLTRVALVADPRTTPFDYFKRSAHPAATSLKIEAVPIAIENAGDIERSIKSFAGKPDSGLILLPSITTLDQI
jgi:ABC-type uncharacterized transport system substrate-binding protein